MSTVATVYSDSRIAGSGAARHQVLVVEGPDQGRACRIEGKVVVGTDPKASLVLTDDRVSRRHLEIERVDDGFRARDLESLNGTLYEGSALSDARLPAGATLKLGRSVLRIQPVARPLNVPPSRAQSFGELVGRSLVMREVFAVLELASGSDVTVLLEGETGTGKELAARALHLESERRREPFVAINCSALPPGLVESELFGHTKGAFTGATSDRKGAFARAHRGTLFLDELDSIPPNVQAALLRVLEERKVRPVGAEREQDVDVRLVAASQDDLDGKVAEGSFRADLFYRLAVVRVRIPPLRARREDIAPVARALLRARGIEGQLPTETLEAWMAHDWPGNVRELRNAVDRAIALSPGANSAASLRFVGVDPQSSGEGLEVRTDLPWSEAKQQVLDEFERRYLQALLERFDGNVSAASRACGLDRKQLRTLAKRHGLL